MRGFDQNSAVISLEQALVPGSSLIDGRTEQDQLSFLANFASLINFYDHNNTINGNWTPFLLKDPIILLASISKTKFDQMHSLYLLTCFKLEQILVPKANTGDIPFSFNQLFDQLTRIFMQIKYWIYFMHRSADDYNLKNYVISQVKAKFSKYFWAILSLRQNLFLSSAIKGIDPIDRSKLYFFESHDELIWKQNKDKSPYWEVLNLEHPIKKNNEQDFFNALKTVGDELFSFFHTIIQHATPELEKLKRKKSRYPDTILLRTFLDLLKVHQEQLNGISQKHLQFYYKDILKQTEQPAVPDKVFICADLAKKDAAFALPAGTFFDAGLDFQKNSIEFQSHENVSLNPAAIARAYTLTKIPTSTGFYTFSLQNIPNPGVLQLDEDGKIKSWATCGSVKSSDGTSTNMGISFASPMLLLLEGQRTITLTLNFAGEIDLKLLQKAQYYFSTKNAWLKITSLLTVTPSLTVANQATLVIILDSKQPAIEAFSKNQNGFDPDGLKTVWPMFKMEFAEFSDPANPPVLSTLKIEVNVTDIKTFQLYNDYGALSKKAPFQLFGPMPLVNSNFIIGSQEIFSKPLDDFSIELDWANLPPDFWAYYKAYNDFLAKPEPEPISQSMMGKTLGTVKTMVGKLLPPKKSNGLKDSFSDHDESATPTELPGPFNNACFTTSFQMLQNHSWADFGMVNTNSLVDKTVVSSVNEEKCRNDNDDKCKDVTCANGADLLFTTVHNSMATDCCQLLGTSNFRYAATSISKAAIVPDPSIQETLLKYMDTSTSGFIRMELTGPSSTSNYPDVNLNGFGNALYPGIVASIALQNAEQVVFAKKPEDVKPFSPAQLPFVPKVKSFSATYTASQTFDLINGKNEYPIQCYYYAPFQNYPIYDNCTNSPENQTNLNIQVTGNQNSAAGIPLYPSFNCDGTLFLEIENLVVPNDISFYFEMARSIGSTSLDKKIDYYYLGAKAWEKLTLLSDGTNNLSCSGIVKLNVPDKISSSNVTMPGKNNWISIAVNNPDSIAQTVFLKTNGFEVIRSGNGILSAIDTPTIASNTITRPHNAIPQIISITQPFPSFGGKAEENPTKINERVSNRLKTKDRAISTEDYFRLIRQEYDDIYYSNAIYNPFDKRTEVYIVKAYKNWTDPSAFIPMISECKEENIQKFLTKRASAFSNIRVSNFDFEYVKIIASIAVKPGFEGQGFQKSINQALNVYLSPWITSNQTQRSISQEISSAQVAGFIQGIEGTSKVESISFQIWKSDDTSAIKTLVRESKQNASAGKASLLLLSFMSHDIQCKSDI